MDQMSPSTHDRTGLINTGAIRYDSLDRSSHLLCKRRERPMDTQHDDLQAGIRAVRKGDRDRARQHLLRVLQADPQDQTAWLWMSRAMPTTERALRCIDHLLAINPRHRQALEEREVLQVRMMLEEASLQQARPENVSTPQHRYLLGEALVEARVLTDEQLRIALERQAELARAGRSLRLGQILLDLGFVTRRQLEAAIAAQLDRHDASPEDGTLGRIGTFLLRRGLVTRAQIHQGLARQQELQKNGRRVRLGEALVELGYISGDTLQAAMREWEREYESCFY